jgi:hypothetical protein
MAPNLVNFIWFGDIHGPKPYKFKGFGDIHVPKPDRCIWFGRALVRLRTNSHENQFWKNRRFFQNWFWCAFKGLGPSRDLVRLEPLSV